MCRLFGLLSVKPLSAVKYLFDDPCSLFAQSKADPLRLQGDGWGIGFYVNGSLRVIKSSRPVYEEGERFRHIAEKIESNVIVAHIRRASNPRGLPREKLISIENSQPFYYENYVFVHNGVIMIPDEISGLLGDWRLKIRGLNDSEIYFWYIIKELYEGKEIVDAIRNFERDLWRTWQEIHSKYPRITRPYAGLNMILSDGERLYAYCKYDEEADGAIKSLCYGDQLGMQMVYNIYPDRLIISSEKTNLEEEWKTLKNGQLIIGHIKNCKVAITKTRV